MLVPQIHYMSVYVLYVSLLIPKKSKIFFTPHPSRSQFLPLGGDFALLRMQARERWYWQAWPPGSSALGMYRIKRAPPPGVIEGLKAILQVMCLAGAWYQLSTHNYCHIITGGSHNSSRLLGNYYMMGFRAFRKLSDLVLIAALWGRDYYYHLTDNKIETQTHWLIQGHMAHTWQS